MFYSCQTAESVQRDAYYVNGRDLYIKHCQNCHGEKGEGLGELTPPLTDSVFMKNNKTRLACIIKNGLSGPVTIHGKVYEGKMPDFNMASIDIAQLTVYITNGFGHKQGMYSSEQVAKDLKQCR
ncbi:Cytochrome C oxidase, cbb3-type, subunit III [Pedobacter westerhofensis]|uniref:Cytochrome C oxidase, cbb3-type, subunit III n=2 Tax=Pedobacter westerhofensis TaxID=425512 RepID=A0A521BNJ9_9SPHI|nr:Cytochrome C oxidase, cbb3-type, subunit III [Pedobacter westerhofensis]